MAEDFLGGLPPDLAAQALTLRRKQAIAQALLQQGLPPIQPLPSQGRFATPISPFQGAAQLMQAYKGQQGIGEGERGFRGLGEEYNKRLTEGVQSYMKQRMGGPETPTELRPDGPPLPATPGDPLGAATGAIGSGVGPLQKLGFADIAAMNKNVMTTKDWLPLARYFEPKSVVTASMSGDPRALQLKPDIKQHEGQFFDFSDPRNPVPLKDLTRVWTPETRQGPGGPILGQVQAGTQKFEAVEKTPKVTVSVDTRGATALATHLGTNAAKQVDDSFSSARDAAADLNILQNAINAFSEGVRTGSLAGIRNEVSKFAQTAGFRSTDPRVAPSDIMFRELAGRILKHTKELRPMSDTDRKYLEEIKAGKGLDDAGMRRFFELSVKTNQQAISRHSELISKSSKLPGWQPEYTPFYTVQPGQVNLPPPTQTARQPTPNSAAPTGIDPRLWGAMTPEERALWQK
jgi:hypothetical protein